MGISNTVGTIPGILSPALTGVIVHNRVSLSCQISEISVALQVKRVKASVAKPQLQRAAPFSLMATHQSLSILKVYALTAQRKGSEPKTNTFSFPEPESHQNDAAPQHWSRCPNRYKISGTGIFCIEGPTLKFIFSCKKIII
jgi:hypothetical protein